MVATCGGFEVVEELDVVEEKGNLHWGMGVFIVKH